MAERQSRKLAVILHADVVGSTALVQRNETLAHERIRDAFGRFAEDIHAYGGVAHEIRGDALVAEFARASDAVCAALRFQQSNTVHNALMGDETVPVVRVGIALGEEVIAHDTITGAGVVLAQRVEQLAEPGGVCVTAAIQEALPRRMPFEEEGLGEQELKGLEKPVRVYRVRLTPGEAVPEPEASGRGRSASWRPRLVAAVATVAAIIAGAAVLWLEPWATREEPASVERMAFPLPDKPSIAVLPFDNMSGDPEQEYFSDGLTENIITTLSRLPGVFVIARNSTFTYKGQAAKVQRVAEELGVRYVLEGSFQRAKNQIRVHAQFIDALTGRHLWAERFDRQWSDVFALQDDITEKIVSALELELTEEEKARLARRYTTSVAAYDHFLQAQALLFRLTEGGRQEAREQLQQAIRLDPDFARAYGALAYTYFRAAESEFFGSYSEQAYERALELAQTAVEKDASLPQPHGVLAEILTRTDPEQAAAAARKAVELDPNYGDAYVILALSRTYGGHADEATTLVEKALRLNPHPPSGYYLARGRALFFAGRLTEAVSVLNKALEINPNWQVAHVYLAAAYAELDRQEDAQWEADQILVAEPDFTIDRFERTAGELIRQKRDLDALLSGLRKAGLPE